MQSKTIIYFLSNEINRQFIGQHINDDTGTLVLEGKKHDGIDLKTAAALILIYRKAQIKLPVHYQNFAALNKKSFEQSTSEAVALHKLNLIKPQNKSFLNLCGGLGVDDWAFSKVAKSVDSCDIDPEVHDLATYNLNALDIPNVNRHLIDGLQFLNAKRKFDIIYADPDRRPGAAKVFKLEDALPDVVTNMDLILSHCEAFWIKVSPMADLTYLRKTLANLHKIIVISWMGDVREILLMCKSEIIAEPEVIALNADTKVGQMYTGRITYSSPEVGVDGLFLYEPDKAIIKANLSKDYCSYCGMNMPDVSSHIFLSDQPHPDFMGRKFKIVKRFTYKPREIADYLERQKIKKANITVRNFRETPELLKKRFKLNDGGDDYLIFTTGPQKQQWMFHCMHL